MLNEVNSPKTWYFREPNEIDTSIERVRWVSGWHGNSKIRMRMPRHPNQGHVALVHTRASSSLNPRGPGPANELVHPSSLSDLLRTSN